MIELEVYLVIIGEIVRGGCNLQGKPGRYICMYDSLSYYSHCKITPYLLLLYYVCTLQPHLLHRIMQSLETNANFKISSFCQIGSYYFVKILTIRC